MQYHSDVNLANKQPISLDVCLCCAAVCADVMRFCEAGANSETDHVISLEKYSARAGMRVTKLTKRCQMQEEKPQTEVTFIHGTWTSAKKSQWPALRSAIEEHLPKPVRFHYLPWSGRNSVRARYKGSILLKEHLESLSSDPHVPHYIVAHSHGGTVAVLALKDKILQKKVDGLVCLSTPFFHVREHDDLKMMDSVLFGASVLTNALLLAWLTLHNSEWTVPSLIGRSLLFFFGVIVLVGIFSNIADSIRRRMEFSALENIPLLVVRAPADDTTLPLTFFQFLGWAAQWVSWLFRRIAGIAMTVSNVVVGIDKSETAKSQTDSEPEKSASTDNKHQRPLWASLASLAYAIFCAIFAAYYFGNGISWSLLFLDFSPRLMIYTVLVAITPVLVIVCTTSALALVVSMSAALVAAVTSFLVGPELALAGFFYDASVESAPPGRCDFVQLSMADIPPSQLHHSTHSHPTAVRHVALWLRALSEHQPAAA